MSQHRLFPDDPKELADELTDATRYEALGESMAAFMRVDCHSSGIASGLRVEFLVWSLLIELRHIRRNATTKSMQSVDPKISLLAEATEIVGASLVREMDSLCRIFSLGNPRNQRGLDLENKMRQLVSDACGERFCIEAFLDGVIDSEEMTAS